MKGIDVSNHNGVINWEQVKPQIDFAIIRCGYGMDIESQDDKQYKRNVAECERLNIQYGIYLYSYANTKEKLESEIAHVLRLARGLKPFCVYIDMEDSTTTHCGRETLTGYAQRFCKVVTDNGYKAGVYANEYWCNRLLDIRAIQNNGYSVWCAKYSSNKPSISATYDIWQYSSKGSVDGIAGNVDMNEMYVDILPKQAEQPAIKQAQSSIILDWQRAAIADGYSFPKYGADGYWGAECEAVAKKAICRKLVVGFKNRNLTMFIQKHVGVAADGKFGKNTQAAVIRFQKAHGLTADGIVGLNTWKAMLL